MGEMMGWSNSLFNLMAEQRQSGDSHQKAVVRCGGEKAWLNWEQNMEGSAGRKAWGTMGTSERFLVVRDIVTLLDLTTKRHKYGGRERCQEATAAAQAGVDLVFWEESSGGDKEEKTHLRYVQSKRVDVWAPCRRGCHQFICLNPAARSIRTWAFVPMPYSPESGERTMAEAEGRTLLEEVLVDPELLKDPLGFRVGTIIGPCATLHFLPKRTED